MGKKESQEEGKDGGGQFTAYQDQRTETELQKTQNLQLPHREPCLKRAYPQHSAHHSDWPRAVPDCCHVSRVVSTSCLQLAVFHRCFLALFTRLRCSRLTQLQCCNLPAGAAPEHPSEKPGHAELFSPTSQLSTKPKCGQGKIPVPR